MGTAVAGQWQAWVRAGQPVAFAQAGGELQATAFDASIQAPLGTPAAFALGASGTPALVPSTPYFIAVTHDGCASVDATLAVAVQQPPDVFADGFED